MAPGQATRITVRGDLGRDPAAGHDEQWRRPWQERRQGSLRTLIAVP